MKYEFDAKQRHLPLHTDQSQLSLTIALNAQTQEDDGGGGGGDPTYTGGGTYFESLARALVNSYGSSVALGCGEVMVAGLRGSRVEMMAWVGMDWIYRGVGWWTDFSLLH